MTKAPDAVVDKSTFVVTDVDTTHHVHPALTQKEKEFMGADAPEGVPEGAIPKLEYRFQFSPNEKPPVLSVVGQRVPDRWLHETVVPVNA